MRRTARVALLIGVTLSVLSAAEPRAAAKPVPAEAAASGFRLPPPTRTLLKNGLTVLVVENHAIPLIQIQMLVKTGAAADPSGKEGVAALTARLLKRGTAKRPAPQFAQEVEFVGGSIETVAGRDGTLVIGEFASRDVEVAMSLISDMVLSPAFGQEEVAREQRLALAGIQALPDDPEELARQAFAAWLYGSHPYGRPVEGTKKSLAALTRADLAAFYEARYAPNNAVLAIVGDIGATQAAQRADKYFGAWKKRAVPELRLPEAVPVKGRKVLLIDKPDATQSQIRLGNVALRRGDPEYFPLLVGNTILGGGFTSWLVEEVRVKRGLTYGIRSTLDAQRAAGSAGIATFSKNQSVLETIQVALEQVRRMRQGEIPPEDLDKARSFLAGLFPLHIESPDALAGQILDIELYGLEPDYINQYQKKVRGIGLDAVKRAARLLPLDDLAIVVVGPAAALKEGLATLGPVTVKPAETVLEPAP